MRRMFMAIIALFTVGILAWEFAPIQVQIWDGSFDRTVHVECQPGQFQSVSCETFHNREQAKSLLPPEWP